MLRKERGRLARPDSIGGIAAKRDEAVKGGRAPFVLLRSGIASGYTSFDRYRRSLQIRLLRNDPTVTTKPRMTIDGNTTTKTTKQ